MKLYIFAVLVLAPCILAQNVTDFDDLEPGASDTVAETNENANFGANIITAILNSEPVQNKLQKIYNVIDLKIRFVKLVNSLLTRENLILLRRILDLVVRVCNFFLSFLPDDVVVVAEVPAAPSFLESLLPVFQLTAPSSPAAPQEAPEAVPAATENEISITRVNRNATLTEDEQKLIEDHKQDVLQLAKLIYKTQ